MLHRTKLGVRTKGHRTKGHRTNAAPRLYLEEIQEKTRLVHRTKLETRTKGYRSKAGPRLCLEGVREQVELLHRTILCPRTKGTALTRYLNWNWNK